MKRIVKIDPGTIGIDHITNKDQVGFMLGKNKFIILSKAHSISGRKSKHTYTYSILGKLLDRKDDKEYSSKKELLQDFNYTKAFVFKNNGELLQWFSTKY